MNKFGFAMKLSFAVRLALMGMLGLALLNVVQWARANIFCEQFPGSISSRRIS